MSSTQLTPADAQTRVTTDEFTKAVRRIEARRSEESARASGTVAVESTLRKLHIDASAGEVMREVEALRLETAARQAAAESRIAGRALLGFGLVLASALT